MIGRHLKETQGLAPNNNSGKEKVPFNRKKP